MYLILITHDRLIAFLNAKHKRTITTVIIYPKKEYYIGLYIDFYYLHHYLCFDLTRLSISSLSLFYKNSTRFYSSVLDYLS